MFKIYFCICSEHLRLFGKEFNQERLQESLYILYEPEVEATKELFVSMPGLHKDHLKGIPKFSQAYLLDKIELNSKARCSLAWSGNFIFIHYDPELNHYFMM